MARSSCEIRCGGLTLGISVGLEYINEATNAVGAPKAESQIGLLEIIHLAFACCLRIVQSVIMACVQCFLHVLHWTDKDVSAYMSQAMELFWKSKLNKKALQLLKMELMCSCRPMGV